MHECNYYECDTFAQDSGKEMCGAYREATESHVFIIVMLFSNHTYFIVMLYSHYKLELMLVHAIHHLPQPSHPPPHPIRHCVETGPGGLAGKAIARKNSPLTIPNQDTFENL